MVVEVPPPAVGDPDPPPPVAPPSWPPEFEGEPLSVGLPPDDESVGEEPPPGPPVAPGRPPDEEDPPDVDVVDEAPLTPMAAADVLLVSVLWRALE